MQGRKTCAQRRSRRNGSSCASPASLEWAIRRSLRALLQQVSPNFDCANSDAASAWRMAVRWSRTSPFWRRSGGCAANRTATKWPRRAPHMARTNALARERSGSCATPSKEPGRHSRPHAARIRRTRRRVGFLSTVRPLPRRPALVCRSTLSLLALLARRDDPAQLMLIGTYRPAEATGPRGPDGPDAKKMGANVTNDFGIAYCNIPRRWPVAHVNY